MKKAIYLLVALLIATAAAAQMRGTGRLQGIVTDKATGKAIAGAKVTVSYPDGKSSPSTAKSDAKGRWAVLGLVSGKLDIDIEAPGYGTYKTSVAFSEQQRPFPQHEAKLEAEVKAVEEAVVPAPELPAISKETVDAIRLGESLMKEQKFKEAAAEFEKALPNIPTDTPELQTVQRQVQQVLAQAYYKAGELKKAIEMLEKVTTVDPFSPNQPAPGVQLLLVNLYLEGGQLDKAKALLEKVPADAITDPTAYINMGILFFNKKSNADAVTYYTKALAIDPKSAEAYYYRALALIAQKKTKEAKADLEKVIALAPPDSPEARDAKQLLPGLK